MPWPWQRPKPTPPPPALPPFVNNINYHTQNFLSPILYREIKLSDYDYALAAATEILYTVSPEHRLFLDMAWLFSLATAGAVQPIFSAIVCWAPDSPIAAYPVDIFTTLVNVVWNRVVGAVSYAQERNNWGGYISFPEGWRLGLRALGVNPNVTYLIHGWEISERALTSMHDYIT